eukprot:scaffold112141_cov18-Tisochrysis_lutea.AAC.3
MTQIEQTYACMHARSSSVAPLKAAQEAGARLVAVREQAIRCVVSLVACLDVWAGPLKEAGQQARAAGMEQQHGSNGDAASEESSSASGATGPQVCRYASGMAQCTCAPLHERTRTHCAWLDNLRTDRLLKHTMPIGPEWLPALSCVLLSARFHSSIPTHWGWCHSQQEKAGAGCQ